MNYALLAKTRLFRGTTEAEIESMLSCLGAERKAYQKGETIFRAGEAIDRLGMVLSGAVNIENDDLWGNKSILSHLEQGAIFGETYACIPGEPLMVNAVAAEKTQVLFLRVAKVMQTCPSACAHHNKLVKNLLQICAQKNLLLSRRILHTSAKSIRGRLLSYFSEQIQQGGSYQFTVPFNRQQLADYLSVDRSAMCNELSKMQRDGILVYDKNTFTLRETDGL